MNGQDTHPHVDHPTPSMFMVVMLVGSIIGMLAVIPVMMAIPAEEAPPPVLLLTYLSVAIGVAAMGFYLWPMYSTYYTVEKRGLTVNYGPWFRHFSWNEFETARRKEGTITTSVGMPSATPCVRLTDGIILKRKHRARGLCLTPDSCETFMARLSDVAPDLVKEEQKTE